MALSGREHVFELDPAGPDSTGLLGYTLRYAYELRKQEDYFRDIKQPAVPADSLQLAEMLIERMSSKLDMNKFEDGYETAVKALVEAKVNNMPVPIDEAPTQRPSNVVNLMDALRKSIGSEARPAAAKKPVKSAKEPPAKGIGSVKTPAKSPKRKSA